MNKKIKLSIAEQIEYMRDQKGITFNLMCEKEAEKFITYNTYYFKIKSYAKNYAKIDGKYHNLDFGHLVELSKIDMYIRKLVLDMCITLEHALKTTINAQLSKDVSQDGYEILKRVELTRPVHNDYTKSLNDKYNPDKKEKISDTNFALWNIIELISFGDTLKLFKKYMSGNEPYKKWSSILFNIKFLRNAAAHSNCLISDLKRTRPHSNKEIVHILKSRKIPNGHNINKMMKIIFIHDFSCLIMLFPMIVKSQGIKDAAKEDLIKLAARISKNIGIFTGNNLVKSCLKYTEDLIIAAVKFYK